MIRMLGLEFNESTQLYCSLLIDRDGYDFHFYENNQVYCHGSKNL